MPSARFIAALKVSVLWIEIILPVLKPIKTLSAEPTAATMSLKVASVKFTTSALDTFKKLSEP